MTVKVYVKMKTRDPEGKWTERVECLENGTELHLQDHFHRTIASLQVERFEITHRPADVRREEKAA